MILTVCTHLYICVPNIVRVLVLSSLLSCVYLCIYLVETVTLVSTVALHTARYLSGLFPGKSFTTSRVTVGLPGLDIWPKDTVFSMDSGVQLGSLGLQCKHFYLLSHLLHCCLINLRQILPFVELGKWF